MGLFYNAPEPTRGHKSNTLITMLPGHTARESANAVSVQEAAASKLLDATLELAASCRPQDGATAAYVFRFLLRLPSFSCVLRTRHDDSDEDDDDDDCCYRYLPVLTLWLSGNKGMYPVKN